MILTPSQATKEQYKQGLTCDNREMQCREKEQMGAEQDLRDELGVVIVAARVCSDCARVQLWNGGGLLCQRLLNPIHWTHLHACSRRQIKLTSRTRCHE